MSIKYTANTLKKMEQLFEEAGYRIRYEKGHFNSGYCVLDDKKIVVVNKFLNQANRIDALRDLSLSIPIDTAILSGEMLRWLRQLGEAKNELIQAQMNLSS